MENITKNKEQITEIQEISQRFRNTPCKIAIQKSGNIQEISEEILRARGIQLPQKSTKDRRLISVSQDSRFGIYYLSSKDIVQEVSEGVDIGVVGSDKIIESRISDGSFICIGALDRKDWQWDIVAATAVPSITNLDQIKTIATQYPEITRKFFEYEYGEKDIKIIKTSGGTEAFAYKNGIDAIVDLTATGASLQANGLKKIGEAPIFTAYPVIILNTIKYNQNYDYYNGLFNLA